MKRKDKFHDKVAEKVRLTIFSLSKVDLPSSLLIQNLTENKQKNFLHFKVNKIKNLFITNLVSITYNNPKKVDKKKLLLRNYLTNLQSVDLENLKPKQKNQNSFPHKEKNFDFFLEFQQTKIIQVLFLLDDLLQI